MFCGRIRPVDTKTSRHRVLVSFCQQVLVRESCINGKSQK